MEIIGYNYAEQTLTDIDSKTTIIDSNIKQSLIKIDSLKNLVLVCSAIGIIALMFNSFGHQNSNNKLDDLEDKVDQLAESVEQDKLDRLASQIEGIRADIKGDQTKTLISHIEALEEEIKALEDTRVEQCAFQFLAIKVNCQKIVN